MITSRRGAALLLLLPLLASPAPATAAVRYLVRERVPGPGPDRHTAPEIAEVEALVRSGLINTTVDEHLGGRA